MSDRDLKPWPAESIAISRTQITLPDDLFDYEAEETARWVVTLDRETARAVAAERELGELRAAARHLLTLGLGHGACECARCMALAAVAELVPVEVERG